MHQFCRHTAKSTTHAKALEKLYEDTRIPVIRVIDIAASSDGAGNQLFHFLPNFPFFTHEVIYV